MAEREMRRVAARAAAGLTVMLGLTVGTVVPAGAVPSTKADVRVTDDFSSGSIRFVVDGIPELVDPDVYKVVFTNDSIGPHVVVGYKIPDGWEGDDLLAALRSDEPPPEDAFFVQAVFAKPGQTHQKKFDVTLPGTYGYFCPIETPSGIPHFDLGFVGVFEVG